MPFNGPVIPFGAMVEYHLFCWRLIETLSIWVKSLARYVPRLCNVCGENLERRHHGRRHWRSGGDGRIRTPRQKAQCKRSVNADERWQFCFPAADGTVNVSGGDQRLRTSTLIRDHPERGEEQEHHLGESDGLSSSTPLYDGSTRDVRKLKKISGLIWENSSCRHHVETRVKLYMPREETFLFPLRYIDVTRTTFSSLDVMFEKILMTTGTWMEKDNYQMHGQASQDSFSWTKGHSGRDLRGNKLPQDPTVCGQICESIRLMHQNAMRSKSGPSRNPSSIMPDNHVVSSSFNQMMKNLNIPWKSIDGSWKVRCQQHCFVKHSKFARRNLQQYLETQDEICLYCRCRRIWEDKIGRCAALVSRRSHRCKWNKFTQS